jgi:hypothetical protein
MFRRIGLTLGLIAALASVASAQTLDQIVAKNIQARGGMEKMNAVKTIRMTGTMTVGPGMDAPLVIERSRPNMSKVSFTLQGMTGAQAYDGKTGWAVMPFMGKKDPEAMSADDTKELADEADFDGPFVNWKAKGITLELLGKESVEGTDAWKIKATLKSGTIRTIYLDADSYLEIKSEGKRTMHGTEMEIEGTVGDYKEVSGLILPYSMENSVKGRPEKQKITITKIELNPVLASDYFTMPAKPDSTQGGAADGAVKATDAKGTQKADPATANPAAPKTDTKAPATSKKPATGGSGSH